MSVVIGCDLRSHLLIAILVNHVTRLNQPQTYKQTAFSGTTKCRKIRLAQRPKLTSRLSTIKVFSKIVIASGEASLFVKALLVVVRLATVFEPPHDKTNKITLRPAKTQISLGIRPVWSESSLCAHWVAKDPSFLHADSEDSDQIGRLPRLIWVFAGHTANLLVLSWGGSFQSVISLTLFLGRLRPPKRLNSS